MLTRVNNILTCDSKLEKFLSLRNHSWSAQGCRVTKAMQKPKPALRNAIITHSSRYQLCILVSCNACKYYICKYPCISTANTGGTQNKKQDGCKVTACSLSDY